jgi:type VI protein secretion system component VasK
MDIEISTSTWMLVFFVIFLVLSIWKIWAFLPNKQLEDDDRTQEAQKELVALMLGVIKKTEGKLNAKELFVKMQEDPNFNSELFWRFNHNRLNQLLKSYYAQHPQTNSIEDIYKSII